MFFCQNRQKYTIWILNLKATQGCLNIATLYKNWVNLEKNKIFDFNNPTSAVWFGTSVMFETWYIFFCILPSFFPLFKSLDLIFSFEDSTPLAQIPKETEVLIFNGNNVPYMRNNVIGMTNEHEVLKVIDFSNNRIEEITGKAFHKVSNVEKLILDHNQLSISGMKSIFYEFNVFTHPRLLCPSHLLGSLEYRVFHSGLIYFKIPDVRSKDFYLDHT